MDFFTLPHQKQPAVTEDEDGATESFARAIDDRFNNPAPTIPSVPAHHNLPLPLSLSLSSISRNNNLPSPHTSRSHSHHFPTPSPDATLFTAVAPADLPQYLSDPHTLILDIRPLPTYLASRVPHALPLSVPSTLLKRPLFPTARLAEMLPTPSVRRKFSEWRSARRILVYDADSAILPEGNNVLGLLRKFRSEAGLSADLRSSGAPSASPRELQLNWLKGGFQAVFREQQSLLDFNFTTNDDDDDDTPSPPSYADRGSEQSDPTSMTSRQVTLSMPMANHPALLRTKHLPMSAFTANSTTSQRSGSTHHKHHFGQQQTGSRDVTSAVPAPSRAELLSRPSLSGTTVVPQSTSDPSANVAYNPFYDTIRQNIELSHGITERIPLRISRMAKDRIDDLPFNWLRELGRWAAEDDEGSDDEDHFGESGSGSGSGISGGDHSGMSSDSGEDSGSGHEYAGAHHVRMDPAAVASTSFPTNNAETNLDDSQAEGSEALAMQFYRIELGEQRRLMGVMEHHSKESGRIMEGGEKKGSKSKSKRSKQRSKGTGRSSRGKHSSRDFPYSITAGVEKGAKNRYRNIWPFEHARVRLRKQKPKQRPLPSSPSSSNPGSLRPLTLPQPTEFLPPVTLSFSSTRSIHLPLNTPVASSTDDYVNASYVQPLGTKKRYIATQGPLPETFNDFWLLVWEQNVHVIVMLTREVEGSTVKCGNYWSGEEFGPLRLKLLEVSGAIEEYEKSDHRAPGDPFFPAVPKTPTAPPESSSGQGDNSSHQSSVKRVLELSHTSFPHLPSRRIVQFQYLDWPDLNVPNDTRGVLELIGEVEREIERSVETRESWEGLGRSDDWRGRAMMGAVRPRRSNHRNSDVSPSGSGSRSSDSGTSSPSLDAIDSDTGILKHALGERPVLLHCSAGVGRTGGFIAIDAVLDGIRREIRKRREGLNGGSWGDSQISKSRSGRDIGNRAAHTSGSSTSEKDRTSSGDEVAAMDVDEASAGGSAPPVPGLVMKLSAEDNKAVVHVPVVGMISSAPTDPSRQEHDDATNYAAISPWAASVARNKLQAWNPRTQQSEPLSSPSSSSAHESRPSAPSGESVKSAVSQALSRSLSPSGDSSRSDISALSLPPSANSSGSLSPSGRDVNGASRPHHHKISSLASAVGANMPIRTSSGPTSRSLNGALSSASPPASSVAPTKRHVSVTGIAQPIAKRASVSSVPLDTENGSDSSRGRSTGPSSLLSSGTKSGSPETLPTDPSLMDLSSEAKAELGSLLLPFTAVLPRKSGSKSSESPPANEDSPNSSDPYYSRSQSHSKSDQRSPPAFYYTRPRQLHDDRHSPVLLSTLDEPIHRVIEDMREQRMSLCQSLRQYVFVHRAVIEGVLMLVDDERTVHGKAWKDSELEELTKSVSERFPIDLTRQAASSESGSIEWAANAVMGAEGFSGPACSITSSSEGGKSYMEVSPTMGKRRASPTELPKEDKRGDMRMSKRPIIKRALRGSEEYSPEELAAARRYLEDVAVTPVARR